MYTIAGTDKLLTTKMELVAYNRPMDVDGVDLIRDSALEASCQPPTHATKGLANGLANGLAKPTDVRPAMAMHARHAVELLKQYLRLNRCEPAVMVVSDGSVTDGEDTVWLSKA